MVNICFPLSVAASSIITGTENEQRTTLPMVIHIDPNRVSIGKGVHGRSGERSRRSPEGLYKPPVRADVNHIPAPEALRTLVASAVAALREGVRWDRGTILNVLV